MIACFPAHVPEKSNQLDFAVLTAIDGVCDHSDHYKRELIAWEHSLRRASTSIPPKTGFGSDIPAQRAQAYFRLI